MEALSASLAICAGNSPVTGKFPAQRPVMRCFDVFFDLRLNKRLSKQSRGWLFETPSRPLLRHCNDYWWVDVICLPIFLRVASLALGQSCDCPSASEATLKDMGKIHRYQTTTKDNEAQHPANRVYNSWHVIFIPVVHYSFFSWWRHQMETFSMLLAIFAGNSSYTSEFPAQGQWRGALVFFDLGLNKRLSKQS